MNRASGGVLLLLCLCSLAGVFPQAAAAAVSPDGRPAAAQNEGPWSASGIYILNPIDKPIPKDVLALDDIVGISLRVSWSLLEPEKDRFEWVYLDREISAAARAGKTVTLRVLPGSHTPNWVYDSGAVAFEFVDANERHPTFGKEFRIPLPWDEVFLSRWKGLIAALGARYNGSRTISIVHLTGPNRNSAEMHLPRRPEDRKHWKEFGYTPAKLILAWNRCIDAWARAFPRTPLALNLSPAIFDDGVIEEVVQGGVGQYGRRFMLQNNALTAKPVHRRADFAIIRGYAGKTTVGFQMLGTATAKSNSRQGDLKQSIDNGLAMGARYFEIYPHDAKRLPQVIRYGADRLRRNN